MHAIFGSFFYTQIVSHAKRELLARRCRRRLSPCLRETPEEYDKSSNTGPHTFGCSHDAVENDPDEQFFDVMGHPVSCSLHSSCLFRSGIRGFEAARQFLMDLGHALY